jgi:hypothetical protein
MRPLYIFDLDGTLALIHHRRHFVEDGNRKWTEFYAACIFDEPNMPVINTMNALCKWSDIWIFSGRSDEVRKETVDWLGINAPILMFGAGSGFGSESRDRLIMRPAGDYTPDDKLKRWWYNNMLDVDKQRLVAAFDDRNRIVKMWRDLGVTCFQVAEGDF